MSKASALELIRKWKINLLRDEDSAAHNGNHTGGMIASSKREMLEILEKELKK